MSEDVAGDPIIIPGLPARLERMPVERHAWASWRDRVIVWRAGMRLRADADEGARREAMQIAAASPLAYWSLFGCVMEPRDRRDLRGHVVHRGWLPLIPFPFQAQLASWVDRMLAVTPGSEAAALGRGDGVVEKARGMAFSWTIAAYVAHRWLFDDNFIAGLMSYKEDLVERRNATDTLFFKVEANLGIDERVPFYRDLIVEGESLKVPIRPPAWLIPDGFDQMLHNSQLLLVHPKKMNVIQGYTTTSRSGTGARLSLLVIDEAAKFTSLRDVWEGSSAVTDHRLAASSADIKYGTAFRDLARWAEDATARGAPGPSFLRLRPEDHPERDSRWREEIMARHAADERSRTAYAREYELDYAAGHGALIYPYAHEMEPAPIEFDPAAHALDLALDPGIREQTAFHLLSYDPERHRYGLLASYVASGQPAEFYATLFLGMPRPDRYRYGPEEDRILTWFERYGHLIRFWIGDPAGHQRGGIGVSFYEGITNAAMQLSDGRRRIVFQAGGRQEYRRFASRHEALRWLLPLLDINDAPDTRETLRAIRDYRYRALDDDATIGANATPIRSFGHDRVTALEYYAVHRRLGESAIRTARVQPRWQTMSGKPRLPRTAETILW